MGFVLHHRPEPFVGGYGGAGRRDRLAGELLGREAREDGARLRMHPIEIPKNFVEARGQFLTRAGIPTRTTLDVLAVHPPLDGGKMANQIAQGPSIGGRSPFEAVGGNQQHQPAGPVTNAPPVFHELRGIASNHRTSPLTCVRFEFRG